MFLGRHHPCADEGRDAQSQRLIYKGGVHPTVQLIVAVEVYLLDIYVQHDSTFSTFAFIRLENVTTSLKYFGRRPSCFPPNRSRYITLGHTILPT